MDISHRIKEIREELNLTQQKFADKLEVSRGFIGDIEHGKMPSFNFLMKIISSTEYSVDWLLTGQGEKFRKRKNGEKIQDDMSYIFKWLKKWWANADEEHRIWLKVQLTRCFPEFEKWLKQQKTQNESEKNKH